MSEHEDKKARDIAARLGIPLMTLDAALTELEGLHASITAGDAKPAVMRSAIRNEALVSALAMCDGVDELLDQIRDVRGFAQPAETMRVAIRRATGSLPAKVDAAVWDELRLKVKADGTVVGPECSLLNAITILRLDEHWKGRIKRDLFSLEVLLDGAGVDDVDEIDAAAWLDEHYRIQVPVLVARQAMQKIAKENQTHPVRDYLEGLEWDGVDRLDGWLSTFCGSPRKKIIRAYSRRWMISAVARVMVPGCKVDTTLIIQGDQGVGKSTAFAILSGAAWFSDTGVNLRDKDAMAVLQGVWIYEFAELDAVRRTEQTSVKAFLTSRVDKFRPAYGRNVIRSERQCVIVGTTNDLGFLRDRTGSRRFWPVQVGKVDTEGLAEARDQLWAEAVVAFKAGEQWHLTEDEEARRVASEHLFVEEDAWTEAIEAWLRRQPAPDVAALDVWIHALGKKPGDLTQTHQRRVIDVLISLECEKRHTRTGNVYTLPSDLDS